MPKRIFTDYITDLHSLPGAIVVPNSANALTQPETDTDSHGRLWVRTDLLALDPDNANEHNQESIENMAVSLCLYGQQKPIVVQRNGMIVRAGNGLLMAAQLLQKFHPCWKYIWCNLTDLDDQAATAYALDDNRLADYSKLKAGTVSRQLKSLQESGFDLSALSFPEYEIDALMRDTVQPSDEPEVEAKPKKPREPKEKGAKKNTNARLLLELTGETADLFNWIHERVKSRSSEEVTQQECIHIVIAQYVADEQRLDEEAAAQDVEQDGR